MRYALIYFGFGFGFARQGWQVWALYALYGIYYGLAFGTTKALVADLVKPELRGKVYGTYNAVLGILNFPASFLAGKLWQGVGTWEGFGPAAPFIFGALTALGAAVLMFFWHPEVSRA